jgi:hypothetical protein
MSFTISDDTIRKNPTASLRNIKTPTDVFNYTEAFICEDDDSYWINEDMYKVDVSQFTQEERDRIKEMFQKACEGLYYDKTGGNGAVYFTGIIYKKLFK